jgi:oligosaccharide repeat unit polymerase
MSLDKCLALVFSLLILGQAYLVRRYVGTWLFPACIFGLFWFGYTFIPLAILFWVPVQPYATAFIFLCTLAFSMGSLLFDWKTALIKNGQKDQTPALVYGSPFLRAVFYVSTLSSLVFLLLNSIAQGFSLRDLMFDLYGSAAAYADLRYSEGLNDNIYSPLGVISAYVGVILGGLLFQSVPAKGERRLIVVLSFLPSILVAVTQSAKGFLFLCVVLFYAGLLAYRALAGTLRLFEKGSIKSMMLYTAVLIATVTISFLAGGLYKTEDNRILFDLIVARFATYTSGHIYAFSDWFAFMIGGHSEFVYHRESAAYGFYTFAPLFKLIGSHRVMGLTIFDEDYLYRDLLDTNIFTLFRGLIQDFGIIGTVLFMIATGLLLHWAFHTLLLKRTPVFTVAVFVFMMGYFYTSFGVSLLISKSIYVTFVLVWLVLQLNKLITHGGGRWSAQQQPPFAMEPYARS